MMCNLFLNVSLDFLGAHSNGKNVRLSVQTQYQDATHGFSGECSQEDSVCSVLGARSRNVLGSSCVRMRASQHDRYFVD